MTDPVDPLALARETLERDAKATAGPWTSRVDLELLDGAPSVIEADGAYVAQTRILLDPVEHPGATDSRNPHDAEFIAHARTAGSLVSRRGRAAA